MTKVETIKRLRAVREKVNAGFILSMAAHDAGLNPFKISALCFLESHQQYGHTNAYLLYKNGYSTMIRLDKEAK